MVARNTRALGLLGFAIGVGIAFVWTRSLVPGIAAHMLINVPAMPAGLAVILVALFVTILVAWRYGASAAAAPFWTR